MVVGLNSWVKTKCGQLPDDEMVEEKKKLYSMGAFMVLGTTLGISVCW